MVVEGRACGKLILFGEHAVVHGQPAIAVPLKGVQATVEVEESPAGTGLSILIPDLKQLLHVHLSDDTADNALIYTARLVLEALGKQEPDLKLVLRSSIPIAAGFGSGAAVSTALARGLCDALGEQLEKEVLNDLIFEVEKIHHGNPSGIDNTVIVHEQPIVFMREKPFETFSVRTPLQLLVAHVGYTTPTHVTVGDVGKLYASNPERIGGIFEQIGTIAKAAREAIEGGDLMHLGTLMNENHELLRELTVSDELMDRVCEVAVEAGTLGAKLSGGGRGGNVIVLVTDDVRENVEKALKAVGVKQVIHTVVT